MSPFFRKVEPKPRPPAPDSAPTPGAAVWVAPSGAAEAGEALLEFLGRLREGRLRATRPLVMAPAGLQSLYRRPPAGLAAALGQQLDALLVEMGPDPARWGPLAVSPALLGVSVVAHNLLSPNLVAEDETQDPVVQFSAALLASLPPARELADMLAYHAVLVGLEGAAGQLSPGRQRLWQGLLHLSPLSAATCLDGHLPPALTPLAGQLLPWRKRRVQPVAPWRGPEDWLQSVTRLLQEPRLEVYLRRRWLALPESQAACCNLGLLLEALRRRGGQRRLILSFYEAYDHLRAQVKADAWSGRARRTWPVLEPTGRLLRAGQAGSGLSAETAQALNRRGCEYFLKFYPLLATIQADGHPPNDFHLLSTELILALRPLLDWVALGPAQELKLSGVTFENG